MSLREELERSLGGSYSIERELGGGGMSHVFVATETALGRRVVVKLLSAELAPGLSGSRFEREIRLAAALQQANIVPLLSAGEFDGRPYYTMPFVDGLSLRHRLSSGPLPIGEVVSVLRDIARALAYAHERGVVHRDIKPDNVLLSGDAAVVTDFGIAKALIRASTMTPDADGLANADASVVTQIGTAIGTPAYMAPEQGVGDPSMDHRADLYALGCLGYELLCGETPFHARPVHQTFLAHVNETPTPIGVRRPDCPPGLAQLVTQCLEKDPAKRPQSAREILQALDTVSSPSMALEPRRHSPRARLATIASAVVVVLTASAILLMRRAPAPSAPEAEALKTLAVLPFENAGGDSAREYLVDGMTDELATAFGKLPGVRVAARTSTYRYKRQVADRTLDIRQVGRDLAVRYVLVGSIRLAGQQLVASAQLTDASTLQEIWSQTFNADAKNLFGLQGDLAHAIAGALSPQLSTGRGTNDPAQVARGTADPAASDLYMHGLFFLYARRTLPQAVDLFQQAIDKDSSFARAYAALGETLEYLPYFNGVPADSVRARSMRAAQHALAIDSTLAQAHIALGLAHMHALEWNEAGDEFRRAVAADSNNAAALTQYVRYLLYVGRPADALAPIMRASALEPFSAIVSSWKIHTLSLLGRHDEALAESRRAFDIDTTAPPLIQLSTLAYVAAGRTAEARRISMRFLQGSELRTAGPPFGAEFAYAAGVSGDRATALRLAREFEAEAPRAYFAYSTAAAARIGAGDTTRALDDLELATNAREIWPSFTPLCDYSFDSIRGSKRFAALVRRVGLDDALLTRPGACRAK